MADITDHQLVARARRGDAAAFERLVGKYQDRLGRVIARFVRDPAEVEDLTQEALLRAYRGLGQFRGSSAFYTWLYRIGVNAAKNHLAARRRRVPAASETIDPEAAEEVCDGDSPEQICLAGELAAAASRALERLPAEMRGAIEMRELELMSYGAIARAMRCPLGTVRSRVFRGREALARELEPLLEAPLNKRWS